MKGSRGNKRLPLTNQIIVLGMHRSGTSATTALLASCGAYVGTEGELTKPNLENRRGFFERIDMRQICDALLQGAGADWWKVRAFDVDLISPLVLAEQNKKIQHLVSHLNPHGAWALKEPRLCLLLPVLRRHLQKQAACVFVYRDPLEVAQSLRRRNGFPRAAALALWEAYVVAALRHSASMPRVMLSFADLVANPMATAKKLVEGLTLAGVEGLTEGDPAGAIDSELRHEHRANASFAALLSPAQAKLWDYLSAGKIPPLAHLQLSEEARLILEDVEIDRAAALEVESRKVDGARLTELENRLAVAAQDSKRLESMRKARDAEVELRRAAEQNAIVSRMESTVDKGRAERAEIRVHEMLAESQAAQTRLAAKVLEVDSLAGQLNHAQVNAREIAADLRVAQNALATKAAELKSVELQAGADRSRADRAEAEAREVAGELRLAQNALATKAAELKSLEVQAEADRRRADRAEAEAREARSRGVKIEAEHERAMAALKAEQDARLELVDGRARAAIIMAENLCRYERQIAKKLPRLAAELGPVISSLKITDSERLVSDLLPVAHEQAAHGTEQSPFVRFLARMSLREYGRNGAIRRATSAIRETGLFDEGWYLKHNPDVVRKGMDPLYHYVKFGGFEGRDPGPNFSSTGYLERNPDVKTNGYNPLVHYALYGLTEGRETGPSLCAKAAEPDLTARELALLVRYLESVSCKEPAAEPATPPAGLQSVPAKADAAELNAAPETPAKSALAKRAVGPALVSPTPSIAAPESIGADAALLRTSQLFDQEWYLSEYKDMALHPDPVAHYLRHGVRELRDPGPAFSTAWYLEKYPDVRRSGVNPLVHYLCYGRKDGRLPMPQLGTEAWWGALVPASRDNAEKCAHRENSNYDVAAAIERMQRNAEPPAVIVPIYNAAKEFEDCLRTLMQHSGRGCRIILIDDASPDPQIGEILESYSNVPSVEVHRNATNLGFTRTVNRGIELAGRSDVILLNSDTKVTPGWIRNLRIAAYSDDKVGTATPLSNNAGAFSAPKIGESNELPAWLRLDEYSRAISQVSQRLYPRAPTGNGFCMYVRRDCIDETGLLDAEAFPRGYGEENDFCMRAGRLDWRHVVDDATLIWHVRSASFGDAKSDLMKRSRSVLDARYPEYSQSVRKFITDDDLRRARERVRHAALAITPQKTPVLPRVLFVLSTRTGGTPQTNQDLMSALDDRIEAFVLRCNSSHITLMHFRGGTYVDLERHKLAVPLTAFPHRSAEYDAVVGDWLVRYAIELVHIRHIAWHGLGLIDVAKAIGLPIVFSFHDFYTICPTVKLLDEAKVYCGGNCTATQGECQHELWREPDFPPLKHAAIANWREQLGSVLEKCDAFVTTSASAHETLAQNYTFLRERPFLEIPHGRDFSSFAQDAIPIAKDEAIRILVPGNISGAKGIDIIADLGKLAATQNIELHVLGNVSKLAFPPGVVIHGAYARNGFAEKVKAIRPHVGGVFSIWPETYCHTLTELWASGVPVIGFDYGAVGERIRKTGAGWLAAEPTAAGIIDIIERLRVDPEEHAVKVAAVFAWQKGAAVRDNCRNMSNAYFDLYRSLVEGQARSDIGGRRTTVAMFAPKTKLKEHQFRFEMASTYVRLVNKTVDALSRPIRFEFCDPAFDFEELLHGYDAVLVQRNAFDRQRAARLVTVLAENRIPLLLDLDDDLIELAKTAEPGGEYHGVDEAILELVHAARVVFVSTDRLKNSISPLNPNVVVEPNAISARVWFSPVDVVCGNVEPRRRRPNDVHVVYMGTTTHSADLMLLKEAIVEVQKKIPGLRLFTVGVTEALDGWYEPIPIPRTCRSYPEFVRWVRGIFATMDFAVAPLVDTPFNHAKSDLKFLEYAAAKLPCIASNVGPYAEVVKHGDTGLLAENTTAAWTKQLIFAATNRQALAEIADRVHADVLAHRLIRDREPLFDTAVLSAVRGQR